MSCHADRIDSPTIVMGANGGLGSAIVRHTATSTELAEYHGLYTVRSSASGAQLSTLLAPEGKHAHTHEVLTLDLTSQRSIRDAAASINTRVAAGEIAPIRALVLNAGFQDFGKQQWVEDGGHLRGELPRSLAAGAFATQEHGQGAWQNCCCRKSGS